MPLPQPTSLRDRTPEFLAIAERLQKQLGPGAAGPSSLQNGSSSASSSGLGGPATTPKPGGNPNSEFARRAADIGHGIHRTSLKLQKLAQLAKRTSMFDDPAHEVDELTGMIKQDIQGLNSAIADLQALSARSREDNKQSQNHSHTVVDNLRSRLKDATQEFRDVLTMRTDNLKHQKDRRQLFTSNTDPEAAMPLISRQRQLGLPPPGSSFGASPAPGPGLPGAAGSGASGGFQSQQFAPQPPQPSFLQQGQQQQQLSLVAQDNYLSSRAEALRNVENTIVELGNIFTKLSEMVQEQGELVVRIDDNIEDTLQNVNNAQAQLLKYLNTISNNKWLVLKVFAVLLLFLFIFIVFIA